MMYGSLSSPEKGLVNPLPTTQDVNFDLSWKCETAKCSMKAPFVLSPRLPLKTSSFLEHFYHSVKTFAIASFMLHATTC